MADISNEIKDYIAKIAGASITNNEAFANMRGLPKEKTLSSPP